MSVVAQRYGYSVQYEVMNDRVGGPSATPPPRPSCVSPGAPRIEQKEDDAQEGQIVFDATFEVYPEVQIGDLSAVERISVSAEVTEEAIDRTVEILRKQRRTFGQRPAGEGVQRPTASPSTSRARSTASLRRRQGRGTSSSSSAKARCSSSSTRRFVA
jgi:trigger factor